MKLRELRMSHRLKIHEVADYLCCSSSVYSRYESRQREPSLDVLLKLSTLYKVSIDYLVDNDTIAGTSITENEAEMIDAMRRADDRARSDALTPLKLHKAIK